MTLLKETIRELVGQVGGYSEPAFQHLIDAETERVTQYAPLAPDDALRDSVIVNLIKLSVEFQGKPQDMQAAQHQVMRPLFAYNLLGKGEEDDS